MVLVRDNLTLALDKGRAIHGAATAPGPGCTVRLARYGTATVTLTVRYGTVRHGNGNANGTVRYGTACNAARAEEAPGREGKSTSTPYFRQCWILSIMVNTGSPRSWGRTGLRSR